MTQIKLSIAFVLAAAAIAPIVAQPIREGNEFASNAVDLPHHHHHHHHHPHHHRRHHKYVEQSPLEPTSDATPPPSPREFVDEFEARGLLLGEGSIVDSVENNVKALGRQDTQLEHTHQTLEAQNGNLKHTNGHLENVEGHLKQKDQHLQREGGKLKHINHSLKKQNKFYSDRKHHLLNKDNKLGRKRKTLARKDKVLGGEHRSLSRKNKALGRKDKVLGHEDKAFEHHNGVLREGLALAHRNEIRGPHKDVVAREYADSDELTEDEIRTDKVLGHEGKAFEQHNGVLREGLALAHKNEIRGPHKDVVAREYADSDEMFERAESEDDSARLREFQMRQFCFGFPPDMRNRFRFCRREYVESDDNMFERDSEDLEFDAREFDDDVYLD